MRRCAVPVLMLALASGGCGRPAPPPATLPRISAGSGLLDGTHFSYGTWGEGKAVFVWSSMPVGRTSTGATANAAEYSGLHLAGDGRRIEWTCTTTDGQTGSIAINGERYQLGEGRLFLVGVEGGETTVVQLDQDTAQLTDENMLDALKDWLDNNGAVSEFFADVEPFQEQ